MRCEVVVSARVTLLPIDEQLPGEVVQNSNCLCDRKIPDNVEKSGNLSKAGDHLDGVMSGSLGMYVRFESDGCSLPTVNIVFAILILHQFLERKSLECCLEGSIAEISHHTVGAPKGQFAHYIIRPVLNGLR